MALAKCRECGAEVSDAAKTCPKCGISKPVKKISLLGKIFLGFFVLIVFGQVLGAINRSSRPTPVATQESRSPAKVQITKKDGTVDQRANDLDEICQDWVRAKAKSYKYGREGNQEAAAAARKDLADTTRWLSDYRDEDVARVCAIYDTPENLAKWMK